ncbi:adenylate/guanylate cyclase domain-containing protein [Gelidibacter pelagius]|uniref:Adenylate/guanylate cyclase domain-containing protein n=1 Tax=Gelidibacter pelagius TaxID=2819985 RepID=A0ABS3SUV0_9FLAO|nr:adenylate/guanylate cyclase domain-containing protein [Gelidibacter pelagius]MBO3099497.1 adenylate/guanylate cyclase domain-containing protein [Gelidibacter pelagius]
MDIFRPYLNVIKKAVNQDPKNSNRLFSNAPDESYDLSYIQGLRNELPGLETLNESRQLIKGLGSPLITSLPRLGNHPDFSHLRSTTATEKHWIISAFVDVQKSTQLHNRFTLATVALITEGIVKASIFAVNLCGGYVHRIQGDGLMVYFGGKNIEKSQATKDALKAFAMISFFVKNDLKDYFESNGIKDIYTRSGIDLGHDNQVLWMYSGIGESGEVTTCSLHTSLAPKMQATASSNGIVVGQYLINQLTSVDKYFNRKSKPIWDYEDGRFYDHYDFNWERYLVDNNFAVQNQTGDILLNVGYNSKHLNPVNLSPIAKNSKPYFDFK